MTKICDKCIHFNVCKYREDLGKTSDKIKEKLAEVASVEGFKDDVFFFDNNCLGCKYYEKGR